MDGKLVDSWQLTGDMMQTQQLSKNDLARTVAVRILLAIPALLAIFFLPAGTWDYWEAWAYLLILLIPMSFVLLYLLRNSPQLLERRMRMREKEAEQSRIVAISILYYLLVFMLPGLDKRFGWSETPVALVVAAQAIVLLSYGLVFLVFRENSYASRVVEVEEQQTVIDSGPYAVVRHPMYVGVILMFVFSPLALGSYWAMLPALLIVPLLMARIRNEEVVLLRDLPGYEAYTQRVKYRLLPGVW